MPAQQQNSNYAAKLGARIAAAHNLCKDAPIDTGQRRLPSGIRNGVAKLSAMYTKVSESDDGKTPKGETFFRASAIVVAPESHNGEKVAGVVTQQVIPLCDSPAKGQRKEKRFDGADGNWFDFQNLFKLLGVNPPTIDQQIDPLVASTMIMQYYDSAMVALCNPQKPVYISFSTRGWTPPATVQQPKPSEMVFEDWHGLATPEQVATLNGQADPGGGVDVRSMPPSGPVVGLRSPAPTAGTMLAPAPTVASTQIAPQPFVEPPQGVVQGSVTNASIHGMAPEASTTDGMDLVAEVAGLVEIAMNDPDGDTPEGQEASARLEELAWEAGWTKEQTGGVQNWAAVGDMALNPPEEEAFDTVLHGEPPIAIAGMRWMFRKRTKEGAPMKNSRGEEFPAQIVEIVTTNAVDQTCTVKTVKDDHPVIDLRSKAPTKVKWEWLESLPKE